MFLTFSNAEPHRVFVFLRSMFAVRTHAARFIMIALSACLVGAELQVGRRTTAAADVNDNKGSRAPVVLASFDVGCDGDPLIIPVAAEVVDGSGRTRTATYRMLVDTGSTYTFFDTRHGAALGAAIGTTAAVPPTGAMQVRAYRAPVLRIGRIRIRGRTPVFCGDLRRIAAVFGEPLDGLLAMDMLHECKLSIDFDGGKLQFHANVGPHCGHPVPLVWEDRYTFNVPSVRARVADGADELFQIDTGAVEPFAGAISPRTYGRLLSRGRMTTIMPVRLSTVNHLVNTRIGTMKSFTLGGYAHDDLAFVAMRSNTIGLGYLSRYAVTFDFPNRMLYLQRGKRFAAHERYDLASLEVMRGPRGLIKVALAHDAGRAEAAGFKRDDKILSIDGCNTRSMSLSAFRRLLATEGRHTCDVMRGDAKFKLTLELARSAIREEPRKGTEGTGRGDK